MGIGCPFPPPTSLLMERAMGDVGCLMGMRIQTSIFAVTHRKQVELIRHPIKKWRRNWSVRVTWHQDPCAYKLGDHTLVCHPAIYEKLKKEFQ